jgi:hypothetical protein
VVSNCNNLTTFLIVISGIRREVDANLEDGTDFITPTKCTLLLLKAPDITICT